MRGAASSFIITARRNAIFLRRSSCRSPFQDLPNKPDLFDDRTGLAQQLLAKAAVSV
jgi:hypothetical protein